MFTPLTVNKICKHASVHRTTFYKHFTINELLKYLLKLTHDDYFATDIKERLNNPFQTLANSFKKKRYLESNLSNITIKSLKMFAIII